jgi:hypothetical protein
MPAPIAFALMAWGDIRFFASEANWDAGNTQVVHELGSARPGQVHPRMGRGPRPQRTRLRIHFDDVTGAIETPQATYDRLRAAVAADEVRIFTNPLGASFAAAVGDFTPRVDEHSVLSADIEFVPDGEIVQISPAGPATSSTAGDGLVVAAATQLMQKLSDAGIGMPPARIALLDYTKAINVNVQAAFSVDLSVDVSLSVSAGISGSATGSATGSAAVSATAFADVYAAALASAEVNALAQVTATASASAFAFAFASASLTSDAQASSARWAAAEELELAQVQADVARISTGIGQMIDVGGLETDIRLWLAFRAAIMLGGAIRSAAVAATVATSSTFVMRIKDRIALLPLAALTYGGAKAQARSAQIRLLNRISTEAWLDPGDYLFPARSSR